MVPSHVLLSAPKRYPSGQANKVMKNNLYIYIYIYVWKKFDKTNNGNVGDAKNDDDDDDDDDSDNDDDDDEERTGKQTNNSVIHLWRYTVL